MDHACGHMPQDSIMGVPDRGCAYVPHSDGSWNRYLAWCLVMKRMPTLQELVKAQILAQKRGNEARVKKLQKYIEKKAKPNIKPIKPKEIDND